MEIISSRQNSCDEHILSYKSAIVALETMDFKKRTKGDVLEDIYKIYMHPNEVLKRKKLNWDNYIKYYCIPRSIQKKDWKNVVHVEAFKKTKQYIPTLKNKLTKEEKERGEKSTFWIPFQHCSKDDLEFVLSSAKSRLADGLNVSSWLLSTVKVAQKY